MADDARQAELRGLMAEALDWHMTEADEARGCALRCGYDGDDRSEHLADHLLPVVAAWAEADREQHAARRAAEAWHDGLRVGVTPAASPVPGQQREAVARWLWDWLNAADSLFRADEYAYFQAKAAELLTLLADE